MALANFSDLKSSVTRWLARTDLAGDAEDFILLGEATLNRELPAVETEATLTGTVSSREIDISSLSIVEPRNLFLKRAGIGDILLTQKADGTFPYSDTNAQPRFWSIDGTKIKFDCPLDEAYSFRFEYQERFALSDASPTNWLLTNHPDVYLSAVLIWGGIFTRNDARAATFAETLRVGIPSVRNSIVQKKRAVLSVDAGLQGIGSRHRGYLIGDVL